MKTNEIVKKIRTDYEKLKSLKVNYEKGQDFIEIVGMRYEGKEENYATTNQISFLYSFDKAITSQLAQIIFKMQSEMAAFSVYIDIYIEKTNGFIK